MADLPVIRMRCTDESAAQLFEAWLLSEGVDTNGTDGVYTLVPTSYPPFAFYLATAAHEHGFAHDDEAAESAREFLAGVGFDA